MDNNSWIFEINKHIKEKGEAGTDDLFPTTASAEEKKFGFVEGEIPNPGAHYAFAPAHIRAVFKDLGNGKMAVKMTTPEGDQISYAIWDESHRPVDHAAYSVAALRARFCE